ncbi:MAG: methionyl-tRNA formyltransferase [Candidatus Dadabacteria bacterium]|nr:MAG: methionyl-tRNA formyltransferase [Candidatus Dadabacteria bacterium]
MVKIAYFGTPDFAVPPLKALIDSEKYKPVVVVTQPDRRAGRGNKLLSSPVKKVALANEIALLQPENIKKEREHFVHMFTEFGPPDIGIVAAFGQILPQWLLDICPAGFINIHASLLPRWRGAAPIQRAIMAGDKETGISLMKMEAGLDSGPVYTTCKTPIGNDDTFETLHDRLATLGAKLLTDNLDSIISGKLVPTPQPTDGITYAHKITADDAAIDWSKNAAQIERQIRALNPFPGAYTQLNKLRLKIFRAKVLEDSSAATAGEVISVDRHMLLVRCGRGALSLLEVQLAGKKRMPVSEFLKGFSLDRGVRFG